MESTDFFFKSSTTGINIQESDKFQFKAFPNPITENTSFQFQLKEKKNVKLLVQNAVGQTVFSNNQGMLYPGKHQIKWDTRQTGVSSGIYFCSIISGKEKETIKISNQ